MQANWDDLKVVLAVSRAGSLTLAADVLGLDQSTCSRRLTALEAMLGTILFVRSKSGLSTTEAGETVIARAIEVERRLNRLGEELSASGDGPAGIVRLVANPWILQRLTDQALAGFLADHPKLDVRLVPIQPRAAVRMEATVSLWFDQVSREPEFAIRLGEVPYAFYRARGSDPESLPWVSFHDEDSPRLAHVKALERVRQRGERLRLQSGDNGVLLSAIAQGLGKGLLPVCMGARHPGLIRLMDGPPELIRVLHLHLHPDTVQTRRIQTVTRWLREAVGPVFGDPGLANPAAESILEFSDGGVSPHAVER